MDKYIKLLILKLSQKYKVVVICKMSVYENRLSKSYFATISDKEGKTLTKKDGMSAHNLVLYLKQCADTPDLGG